MNQELERLCEECNKLREGQFFIASSNLPWEELIKASSEINRKLKENSDRYMEIAVGEENAAGLVKHCKNCYSSCLQANTMLIDQKGNLTFGI